MDIMSPQATEQAELLADRSRRARTLNNAGTISVYSW